MNQVIITGASGLMGSQLSQTLKEQGHEVLAVFNNKPELITADVKKIQCDISKEEMILEIKKQIKPSALIIHCAAIASVDLCEKDKDLCADVNINGTKNVCKLARQTDSTLIFMSTASVFDGQIGNYKENDATHPLNYYSFSKTEGENYVLSYKKGIVIRLIPLGLHLVDRKPASFLEWLVNSFRNNLDMDLFTDVKINPLSVLTIARVISKVPTLIDHGILHLGSRDVVSKADVGTEVMKFFPKYSGQIRFVSLDNNKDNLTDRPKEMWLNVDKAISLGLDLPVALPDLKQYLASRI